MTKHDTLTEEEFATYVPDRGLVKNLHEFALALGHPADELRILDWGCGRGQTVLWLIQQGYQAFGVDVDPTPIANGQPLFAGRGYPNDCLTLLDSSGRSVYPDGFFDYILSEDVLEHVRDIDGVCAEMARITHPDGMGYHVFPAYRQPVEPHLFMPLVHWLPPGPLRKLPILICVLLGREPDWAEVRGSSASAKAEVYYQYSVNKTFYRSYSSVRRVFQKHDFAATSATTRHPRIEKSPLASRLTKYRLAKGFLNWVLLTFKVVEMQVVKE